MSKDLRSFLDDAEAGGRLYHVAKEVDPSTNIAALADQADRAMLFENVKGYDGLDRGVPILLTTGIWSASFSVWTKREGRRARGGRRHRERTALTQRRQRLAGQGSGVGRADDANLSRLPVVHHSELDGGRYLGSALGIVIDPDTGMHNTTWPRTQITDGKNCPFLIFSPHVGRIAGKYAARGEPMPMALSIGFASRLGGRGVRSAYIIHIVASSDYAGNFSRRTGRTGQMRHHRRRCAGVV